MMVGNTWKAKMNPKEEISNKSPKRNKEPSRVKSRILTKPFPIISKTFWTKDIFNMAMAKTTWVKIPTPTTFH